MLARYVGAGMAVVVAIAVPLLLDNPYLYELLVLAGIYVILVISYDLVIGHIGYLSLAQPAFYGMGAYVAAITVVRLGWGYAPAFLAAVLITGVVALMVGIPIFRLKGHYFGMSTMGILLLFQMVANNWIGLTNGPMCLTPVPPLAFTVAGWNFTTANLPSAYFGILVLVIAVYLFVTLLVTSRVGRAFHAIRANEVLAESQGVHTMRYKLLAFAVSGGLAAIGGAYYVTWSTVVCPSDMDISYAIMLLIMVYLGGAGSVRGVTAAAVIFTVLPQVLRMVAQARLVVYGVLLLLVTIYAPGGFEGLIVWGRKWLKRRLQI